ncbi:MAG: hypothetical protein KGL01_04035 [Betaproteobacteria bacterium]|nr:hypothetical protein [Betaproteobacteria bacterium]
MGYYKQFDEFDPLTGVAPDHPFSHLQSIVTRARQLLKNRTRDEIVSAAHNADWFIDEYFKSEKDDYIRRLLDRGGWELEYLPEAQRNKEGIRWLLDNWPSEADDPPPHIPTPENTSELDALKECIGWYVLDDDAEFQKGREFEYFAVLALWLVADAMECLKWSSDQKSFARALNDAFALMPPSAFPEIQQMREAINNDLLESKKGIPDVVEAYQSVMQATKAMGLSDTSINLSLAGGAALEAMDAVCYAEHLCAVEMQTEEIAMLRNELNIAGQKSDALAEEKMKQKISLNASNAAIKRHTETTHKKRQEILDYWRANIPREIPNEHAAEILQKAFPDVAHRTLAKYVSEAKKLPLAGTL